MKRNAILTLLIACVWTMGYSQVKDEKAVKLLEEVSQKAKAAKSIKVDFSYSMVNAKAKINEEKSGTLLLSGDKYRMTVTGQTVISNGETIWTYIKETNEVQVNTMEDKDDAMTPSKLLTSYNANFKSKIIKSTDPAAETVELIPNASKTFTRAVLSVDKVKKQVKKFTLYDKSGNVFTYTIKTYATDTPVTPADFNFDVKKYPGVEVIDMR